MVAANKYWTPWSRTRPVIRTAVDAVAAEDDLEEVTHHAVEVEGIVRDGVAGLGVGLAANLGAGQALGVLGVVDDAVVRVLRRAAGDERIGIERAEAKPREHRVVEQSLARLVGSGVVRHLFSFIGK